MLEKDTIFFQGISQYFQKSSDNKYLKICKYFPDTATALKELAMTDGEENLLKSKEQFCDYITKFRGAIKLDAVLTSGKSFVKIKFRGLGSEKPDTCLAKDDQSLFAINKFMKVYESFQRNHRTTLNQALTAYIKRKDIKHLLLRARCERDSPYEFDNFFDFRADNSNEDLHFFVFNIPSILQDLLLNDKVKDKLLANAFSSASSDNSFENLLKVGVENCYWSLRHNEKLNTLKEEIIKAGSALLLDDSEAKTEQNEQDNEDLILREMCRLLLGVCIFIEYNKGNDSQLDIYLTTSINKKWIGFLSRLGKEIEGNKFFDLFSGLYFATEKLAPEDKKKEADNKLEHAIKYGINQPEIVEEPDKARNDGWKSFIEMIKESDSKKSYSDEDYKFIKALAATLRFSTLYRPFSVHEGKEQQLNFVVGFPDDIKSLLAKRIPLLIRETEEHFVYLPLKIDEPKDIIDARSFFKSFCNIFNNKDIAVFVDASSIDEENDRVSCPYVAELEIPVFRYSSARQLCDVIKDKHTALINIYGRSKIDFFYQGQTVLHWADHDFMWAGANCWSVENLTEKIGDITKINKDNDENKRLNKIINILFSISRLPREGAAVCFCSEKQGLNLDESSDPDKFVYYVSAMTDKIIKKVNFLDNILKIDDKVIENMLTLDGGAIFDIKQGELWARRKFTGNDPNFGPDKKIKVQNGNSEDEQQLSRIWGNPKAEIIPFDSLRWDGWKRYKEWGTRHQQSLSFSAVELKEVKSDNGTYVATNNPNFAVLVVSEDGGITLMHNGRVIEPNA